MALVKDLTRLRDQFGQDLLELPWMTSPSSAEMRRSFGTGSPLVTSH
jgi:hypothetical protein